jgi:predicted transposase YdaD
MRESVIYQDILQQGLQQGLQQEANLVLRQLHRRFGSLGVEIESTVQNLAIAQLEDLGEALLDFSDISDLTNWLRTNSQST